MAKLLLNLRNVPDDEADEVRTWLAREKIAFYETTPSSWGISHGGIWLEDDAQLPRAKALMADYQAARSAAARASAEQARQDGQAETFASQLRARPLYVGGVLVVIVVIVVVTLALPWWLLH
ncbi:hypothetical protein SAMN05428989_0786 [Pseudoxanthomonas sp. GM95]|uniref:DUF6164 family protein n=1 Tax=Pseudoxanthomonas sp. GM95 TaxID=1881043 RepID=UPI0008AF46DF|nr:DUF6164 family protein [Pseudoxanthomonas sp. GM95]SEK78069.1 hypothetical protein SAMN05428989_0786 [Pseudoxanthomonas sp. GM95]